MPQIDALIARQAQQAETTATVPIAHHLIADLVHSGIDEAAAGRYFAIFFQLRARIHFIVARSWATARPCASCGALWDNVFTHDIRRYERCLWNRMEDFSTLLLGETGTGKGTAAAAIGRSGFIPFDAKKQCFAESFTRSFVSINLSQFPETLIESELFGHRKGAFTGADRSARRRVRAVQSARRDLPR